MGIATILLYGIHLYSTCSCSATIEKGKKKKKKVYIVQYQTWSPPANSGKQKLYYKQLGTAGASGASQRIYSQQPCNNGQVGPIYKQTIPSIDIIPGVSAVEQTGAVGSSKYFHSRDDDERENIKE